MKLYFGKLDNFQSHFEAPEMFHLSQSSTSNDNEISLFI